MNERVSQRSSALRALLEEQKDLSQFHSSHPCLPQGLEGVPGLGMTLQPDMSSSFHEEVKDT